MPVSYAHMDGVKNADGTWAIRPVHYILFFSVRMSFAEWHHLYIGLISMALGAYRFLEGHQVEGAVEFLLGLWWAIDDIYQHWRQLYEYDPLYHSPVHKLYSDYLWRFNIVKVLTRLADKVFNWLGK